MGKSTNPKGEEVKKREKEHYIIKDLILISSLGLWVN